MIDLKRFAGTITAIIIIVSAVSFVNNLDLKMAERESAWQETVQAIEAEQQQIEIMLLEAREELIRAEKQIQAHNVLIWDIRNRVHLDIGWEIEQEMEEWNQ